MNQIEFVKFQGIGKMLEQESAQVKEVMSALCILALDGNQYAKQEVDRILQEVRRLYAEPGKQKYLVIQDKRLTWIAATESEAEKYDGNFFYV